MATESKTPTAVPKPTSKRGIRGFFAEVKREMKKVSWPTTAETNRLTGVVLAVCGMLIVGLAGIGKVFDTIIHMLTTGGR